LKTAANPPAWIGERSGRSFKATLWQQVWARAVSEGFLNAIFIEFLLVVFIALSSRVLPVGFATITLASGLVCVKDTRLQTTRVERSEFLDRIDDCRMMSVDF
jgi:hypothetical protein